MSLLSKFLDAENFSKPEIASEQNFETFGCGHKISECGWWCSSQKKLRCSICDRRKTTQPTLAESAAAEVDGDMPEGEREEIDGKALQPSPYAFCEVTTPNGAYSVATRFPGDWGASSGNRRSNTRATYLFGWDDPSERAVVVPGTWQEWQADLFRFAETLTIRSC
jgi:hypothetical protein